MDLIQAAAEFFRRVIGFGIGIEDHERYERGLVHVSGIETVYADMESVLSGLDEC